MQEIRCGHCSRKLGVGQYAELQIKCPRCGTLNHFRAASPAPEHRGAPEKEPAHARDNERR